jgi:hypothetical protein
MNNATVRSLGRTKLGTPVDTPRVAGPRRRRRARRLELEALDRRQLLAAFSLASAVVEPDGRTLELVFTAPLPAQYSAPDWQPGSLAGVALRTNNGVALEHLGDVVTITPGNSTLTWTSDYIVDNPGDVITFGSAGVTVSAAAGLLQDSSGNSTVALVGAPVANGSLVDSNGFTTQSFQRGTGGVTLYVSFSHGSDKNTFAQAQNPATPYQTVRQALSQARNNGQNGKGADVRLLRGDTFAGGGEIYSGGQDPQHPFILEDYWYQYVPGAVDPGTRPAMAIDESVSIDHGLNVTGTNVNNIVIRNIALSAVNLPAGAQNRNGFVALASGSNWTLDNDTFIGFDNNIVVERGGVHGLTFLRDVVATSLSGQGALLDNVSGILISQSTFDANGRPGGSTMLHDIYIQYTCGTALVWGNFLTNASSNGIQMRSGGVLAYNYFGGDPIAAFVAAPGGAQYKNVVEGANDISPSLPRGFGLAMSAVGGSSIAQTIEGNIIVNSVGHQNQAIQIQSDSTTQIQYGVIRHNTTVNAGDLVIGASVQPSKGLISATGNIEGPGNGLLFMTTSTYPSWSWYAASNNALSTSATGVAQIGAKGATLAGWRSTTGTEMNSITTPLTFANASAGLSSYAAMQGIAGGSAGYLAALDSRPLYSWSSGNDAMAVYGYFASAFSPTTLPAIGTGLFDYFGASDYRAVAVQASATTRAGSGSAIKPAVSMTPVSYSAPAGTLTASEIVSLSGLATPSLPAGKAAAEVPVAPNGGLAALAQQRRIFHAPVRVAWAPLSPPTQAITRGPGS